MTIICGTGHRPNKLVAASTNGYSNQVLTRLIDCATVYLERRQPSRVISGGALGWDTALAIAAIRLEIPIIVAVPFQDFPDKWQQQDQKRFYKILNKATDWVLVDEESNYKYIVPGTTSKTYHISKLQKRNMWMVDNSDRIVALHNGTPGGTNNCLVYNANTKRLPVDNMWSNWVKYNGF